MKKLSIRKITAFMLSVLMLASYISVRAVFAESDDKPVGYAVCTAKTSMNLRTEASSSSSKAGDLTAGTTVPVYSKDGNWYKIYYNGSYCWAFSDYLSVTSVSPIGTAVCTAETFLNVRSQKDTSSTRVGTFPKDETAYVFEINDNWYRICYKHIVGWVLGDYLNYSAYDEPDVPTPSPSPSIEPPAASPSVAPVDGEAIGKAICIANESMNLRAKASSSSAKVGELPAKAEVNVYAKDGKWYQIYYNGEYCWAYGTYLKVTMNDAPKPTPTPAKTAIGEAVCIANKSMNLRAKASSSSAKVGNLPAKAEVKVYAQDGKWYQIYYNNEYCWAYGQYLSVNLYSESPSSPTPTPIPPQPVDEPSKDVTDEPDTPDVPQGTPAKPADSDSPSDKEIIGTAVCIANKSMNLRAKASSSSAKVGELPAKAKVNVYEKDGNWYQIYYNGQYCWAYGTYLDVTMGVEPEHTPLPAREPIGKAICIANESMNLREGASASTKKVGNLPAKAEVDVYSKNGSWYEICYNGEYCWAYGQYLSVNIYGEQSSIYTTANSKPAYGYAICKANSAMNLRKTPSSDSTRVGTLKTGLSVDVYAIDGEWCEVWYNDTFCWAHSDYLDLHINQNYVGTAKNGTTEIQLYNDENGTSKSAVLPKDSVVYVYENVGDFCKIYYNGGYKYAKASDMKIFIESYDSTEISFSESAELLLPNTNENIQKGHNYNLAGTVISNVPISNVSVKISKNGSSVISTAVSFDKSANVRCYALDNSTLPSGKTSLNTLTDFSKLDTGTYSFELSAVTFTGVKKTLVIRSFKVVEEEWIQLTSNKFRNNYKETLKFFKSPERFLFKYQEASSGRNITVDPAWKSEYITSVSALGKSFSVHKDAVPYFKAAFDYIGETYVRVSGNGKDSGVVKLSDLIISFNGTFVTRYVTGNQFISHHSFGGAIDVNADTEPYKNNTRNQAVIAEQVGKYTKYNGIKEKDGIKYYDFTYTGSWSDYYKNVPTSLINYMLFEFGFYRAGFGWGYYYTHTCDAMHFTLTEGYHDEHDAENGLRKVYEYIEY